MFTEGPTGQQYQRGRWSAIHSLLAAAPYLPSASGHQTSTGLFSWLTQPEPPSTSSQQLPFLTYCFMSSLPSQKHSFTYSPWNFLLSSLPPVPSGHCSPTHKNPHPLIDQISRVGPFPLNWLSRSLAKTRLFRSKIGWGPRSSPGQNCGDWLKFGQGQNLCHISLIFTKFWILKCPMAESSGPFSLSIFTS